MMAVATTFLGLFAVLTFAVRAVLVAGVFGGVPVEMPLVAATVADPGYYQYREQPRDEILKTTPAVVMTTEAFFFGDVDAFAEHLGNTGSRYVIRHIDGEPQLPQLVETMTTWINGRTKKENVPINGIVLLLPAGNIPMPIVIQVIAGLRKSPLFSRVVLGSGLM